MPAVSQVDVVRHRVVYRIDDAGHTVYVLSVRLRGDVYGVR